MLVLTSIATPPPPAPSDGCVQITATATDPSMKWHCQAPGVSRCSNKHIACTPPPVAETATAPPSLPTANNKNKGLVIFLPGTYLQPQDYSNIVAEFAYHGFLSLGR